MKEDRRPEKKSTGRKLVGARRFGSTKFWTACVAFVCVILVAAFAVVRGQTTLAIYVNGTQLGNAKDVAQAEEALRSAEEKASDILGYDYKLDAALEVDAGASGVNNQSSLEDALLSTVGGIEKLYTLRVDGELVGASSVYGKLETVVADVITEYCTEDTISARFLEDVSIGREYVKQDTTQDLDLIAARISPVNTGSSVSLTVECTAIEKHTAVLPYATEYYNDEELFETLTKVVKAGKSGEQTVSEHVVYVNGVENSRVETGKMVTAEAVTEVVAVGTMPHELTQSWGTYIWPASGTITSYFGYRSTSVGSSDHKGLDIAGVSGQDIVAADGGEVIMAESYYGYGNLVQILHDDGTVTYYGHCEELLVVVGERVCQGQLIARMGATGVASGIHLHFEMRVGGEPVDPLTYLQ